MHTANDLVNGLQRRLSKCVDVCTRDVAEVDRASDPMGHVGRATEPLVRLEERSAGPLSKSMHDEGLIRRCISPFAKDDAAAVLDNMV